jgi:hypothetical protein
LNQANEMGQQKDAALAFEKMLAPVTRRPAPARGVEFERTLDVAVVFTSPAATMAAIRTAGALADRLSARISLLVPQVVPFPAPLESPPVLLDFSERWFRDIAAQSPVETSVQIYLCRDRVDTLRTVLGTGSLVVIGGKKRWWPTRERTMARKLRRSGHEVIFIETE